MNRDDIFNIITQNIKLVLPFLEEHNFLDSDKLVNLGANSVDRLEIVTMTLEATSSKISLLETTNANNLGELVDLINAKL